MANPSKGSTGRSVANVTHYLKGINFPADRDDLIVQCNANGGDQAVLSILQNFPQGKQYHTMSDVMRDYGEAEQKAA
jgi:hypothetical protein